MSQYGFGRICRFAYEPNDKECLEAIWTQGLACKHCDVSCYRQGMSKQKATTDNKKRILASKGAL